MATMATAVEIDPIPEATPEDGKAAFDYTCRFFLGIAGSDFLALWDAGKVDPARYGVSNVISMLPFVR